MLHLIYIYLIFNSFITGYYILDSFNDDSKLRKFIISSVLFFFGAILLLFELISPKILNCFEYIIDEIKFQYRFRLTDYFDKIYLDDNYTDLYDSREKKLKRTEELSKNSSKQVKRHNKQIQERYGNN